jgi:hypothetical protein
MISQLKIDKKNIFLFFLLVTISNLYAQYNDSGTYIEIVNYKKYYKNGPAYKIGYNDSSKSYIDTFQYSFYDSDWLKYQLNWYKKGGGNYDETILTKNKDSIIVFRYANNKLIGKSVMFYDSLSFPTFKGVSESNSFLFHHIISYDENGKSFNEYTDEMFKKMGKVKWMKYSTKLFKKRMSY